MPLQHANHVTKIFWQCISRPEDVEFFLHKQSGFVAHEIFCIADINNSPRKSDFFDSGKERVRQPNSLDYYIRAAAMREFSQLFVQRLTHSVDCVHGSGCSR